MGRMSKRRAMLLAESDEERAARLAALAKEPTPKQVAQRKRADRYSAKQRAMREAGMTPAEIAAQAAAARAAREAAAAQRRREAADLRRARSLEREEAARRRSAEMEARAREASRLPAESQPFPDHPKERELFQALQRDARVWRDRLAPLMPCDPAKFTHDSEQQRFRFIGDDGDE